MGDDRCSERDREVIRERLRLRRRKTVMLVEELSIRTQKVQPLMKKLEQISHRMDELEGEVAALRGNRSARDERANLEKELQDLMLITLEEPGTTKAMTPSATCRPRTTAAAASRSHRRALVQEPMNTRLTGSPTSGVPGASPI